MLGVARGFLEVALFGKIKPDTWQSSRGHLGRSSRAKPAWNSKILRRDQRTECQVQYRGRFVWYNEAILNKAPSIFSILVDYGLNEVTILSKLLAFPSEQCKRGSLGNSFFFYFPNNQEATVGNVTTILSCYSTKFLLYHSET